MSNFLRNAVAIAAVAVATQAIGQVTFYEREGLDGRSFTTQRSVGNLQRNGFNDRASSVMVAGDRGDRWEVCEDTRFSGRCMILRPGRYPSLSAMGLNDRISSVRPVNHQAYYDDARYAPAPFVPYDARRRNNERMYQADVTSVRAVVGPPEQRCWVERQQVTQEQQGSNVPGAIVGAVIGGILGHQVGDGRGRDLATVGGAIAGGAIGTQVGRNGQGSQVAVQDVQRCTTVPSQAAPALWDVSYNFRGQDHRMQMTAPPGPTVTVNRQGEPRA
jgi:uncharacterized protein YcfJ